MDCIIYICQFIAIFCVLSEEGLFLSFYHTALPRRLQWIWTTVKMSQSLAGCGSWAAKLSVKPLFFFLNGLSIKNPVHGKHVPIYVYICAIQSTSVWSFWTSENDRIWLRCTIGLTYICDFMLDIYTLYISPQVTDLFLELLCCHWHKLCIVFVPNAHWLAPCDHIKW